MWPRLVDVLIVSVLIVLTVLYILILLRDVSALSPGQYLFELTETASIVQQAGDGFDTHLVSATRGIPTYLSLDVSRTSARGYAFVLVSGVMEETEPLLGMSHGSELTMWGSTRLYSIKHAAAGVVVSRSPNPAGSLFAPQHSARFVEFDATPVAVEELPSGTAARIADMMPVESIPDRYEAPILVTASPLRVRCTSLGADSTFLVDDVEVRAAIVMIHYEDEVYTLVETGSNTVIDPPTTGTVALAVGVFSSNSPTLSSCLVMGDAMVLRGSWSRSDFYDAVQEATATSLT